MTALARSFWQAMDTRLDRIAIALSALCLIHCVSTVLLLALLASAGGVLGSPLIHEGGLVLATAFGVVALGRGILTHGYVMPVAVGSLGLGMMGGALTLPHGNMEVVWTLAGVGLLALGHDLNRRAVS